MNFVRELVAAKARAELSCKMGRPRTTTKSSKGPWSCARESDGKAQGVVPLPESVMSSQAVLPLTDPDAVDDRTAMEKPAKKKSRRKMRRQRLLQRLEGRKRAQEALRLSEKRKRTVVVGDLQPLIAALPQIDTRDRDSCSGRQKNFGDGKVTGQKAVAKKPSVLREVDHFQKVLSHAAFKEDPLSAVCQHIANSVAMNVI